jgi:hypothetical protein
VCNVENHPPGVGPQGLSSFSAADPRRLVFAHFSLDEPGSKSPEIAEAKLRKKSSTSGCAKDAEKARKICGIACGNAA